MSDNNKIKFTGINLKKNEVYYYDVYTSDFIDQNLYTKANVDTMLTNINASLKFDDAPTKDSSNLLSSGTVYSSLSTEASTRSSADTTLQTNIDTEAASRTNADNQLETSITNAQNFINTLQTDIQTESDLRTSSDKTLQTYIDAKADDDKVVHLAKDEIITGTKIFNAPSDTADSEIDTTWFNTSNGGKIGIGKDSDNNGSSIFLDQTSGTRRLTLSATSTAGAISWTQPEKNSELIFNISKATFNYDDGSLFISGNNVYPSTDNSGRLGSPSYHFNHSYITSNSIAYVFPLSGNTIDLIGSSNSNTGYIKFGTDGKTFGYNGTELKHGDYTVLTAENSYIKDNAITINKETFNSLELGTTKGTAYDGASGASLAADLTSEITNRKNAGTTLQTNIDINTNNLTKEITRAEDSETILQTNIDKKLDSSPDGTNALIKDNKINTLYIPDAILGQVIYGGSIGANGICVLSDLFKSKYPTTTSLTVTTNSSNTYAGVYFIVSADQTIAAESSYPAIDLSTGDWLLSNGTSGYVKIDNTDAVTGVKGNNEAAYKTGNINLTSDNIGTYDKATIDANISTATSTKVDKVDGSSLMTTAEHTKLSNIADGAEINVQADWNATSGDAMILNKPTTVSGYGITDAYNKSEVASRLLLKQDLSAKGSANGYASLDDTGKVPSSQLPSYVDDVIECASLSDFPAVGESGKIYVAKDTNLTYRWGGSAYVEISASLALGETSSTAYAGDKGKAVTDGLASHIANKSNPHKVTKTQIGLGNVENTGDSATPVSGGTTKFTTGGAFTELAKKQDTLVRIVIAGISDATTGINTNSLVFVGYRDLINTALETMGLNLETLSSNWKTLMTGENATQTWSGLCQFLSIGLCFGCFYSVSGEDSKTILSPIIDNNYLGYIILNDTTPAGHIVFNSETALKTAFANSSLILDD